MNIIITEIKTNKIIATYPVSVEGLNYEPESQECFALLWLGAAPLMMVSSKIKTNKTIISALRD